MATARKSSLRPSDIVLYLTPEEATAVQAVLGRVGGNPGTTTRKHTEAAFGALKPYAGDASKVSPMAGAIAFGETREEADADLALSLMAQAFVDLFA